MEPEERAARRTEIPKGYAIVKDGPLQPDDLIFVYPGGGFLRCDSPEWLTRVNDASDAVLAIRRAAFDDTGYIHRRAYTVRRSADAESDVTDRHATPEPASKDLGKGRKLERSRDLFDMLET